MDVDLLNNFTEAISNGRTDVVRTLIEFCGKGFEDGNQNSKEKNLEGLLNSTCSPFGTPLHLATKLNQVDIVRTLLSAGADPSAQNSNGDSAYDLVTSERMTTVYVEELMMCAAHSDSKRIYQLIVAGVGVNSIDSPTSGNTPLHWAASFGNEDIIQLLLDNEASVNARNAFGATPLHDAVDRGNLEIVKKLLKGGANPLCKGNKCKYAGKTPIDLAAGSKEITDLLCFSPLHDASNSECKNGSISSQALSSDVNIMENGLSSSLSHLSLLSDDFPVKHSMDSYASPMPSVNLIPHLTSPPPLITDSKLHLLWPQPQKIAQTGDELFNMKEIFSVQIFHGFYETSSHDIISVWNNHESNFLSMGIKCSVEDVITSLDSMQADIVCSVNSSLLDRPGSYKVTIMATQIKISFSNLLGLHYALCTVEQLFRLFKCEGIPLLYIHDWPMFQCRAALLDMSFGARIPNMETLKECLRILSSLKIRQVHFYITVDIETPNKRPYVSRDLIEYAGYCQQYYLDPVPTIDVAPDVCIEDLMHFQLPVQNMMSLFSSAEIHLGPCLSKIIVEIILKEKNIEIMCKLLPSYSQFLVYLCFDGVSKNMELLELLPPNVVIVEYGFQAEHDFDFFIQTVTHKGLTACIGVGTSAWNSFAGCPDTAINNIHTASQVALSHNGHGLIAMDWSGSSHHTAMCFSWPGLVLTAGLAWNPSVHVDYLQRRLPELLNQHILLDPEEVTGYLLVELGRLEAYIHRASFDANNKSFFNLECKGSILHQLLVDPDSVLVEYLKLDSFHQAICHLKKFEMDLRKAKPSCFQMEEVTAELQLAIDLLIFSCRLGKLLITTGRNPSNSGGVAVINVGMANLPATSRTDLANRLLALTEQFRGVWLSRNLPCGLHSSLFLFNKLLHKLIPENNNYLYQSDGLQKQKLFVI